MKRSIVYLVLICAALAAIAWAFMRFYRAVKTSMAPTACVTTVSPRCSDTTTLALTQFVEQAVVREQMPLRKLADAVQKSFGHCSRITCRQKPSGLVQVAVDVDDPFFIVNEDLVLTEQGRLVPRDFFADESLVSLPRMRYTAASVAMPVISPALHTFLQQMPSALLAQHLIEYLSDEEVWLVHNEHEGAAEASSVPAQPVTPAYVCSVATRFDEPLLGRCAQVVADLEQQQALTKKKARTAWVLDLRFDKQVILYPRMGGQVHG